MAENLITVSSENSTIFITRNDLYQIKLMLNLLDFTESKTEDFRLFRCNQSRPMPPLIQFRGRPEKQKHNEMTRNIGLKWKKYDTITEKAICNSSHLDTWLFKTYFTNFTYQAFP